MSNDGTVYICAGISGNVTSDISGEYSGSSIILNGLDDPPYAFTKYFWDLLTIKLVGGEIYQHSSVPDLTFTGPNDANLISIDNAGMGHSLTKITQNGLNWLESIRNNLPLERVSGEDLLLLIKLIETQGKILINNALLMHCPSATQSEILFKMWAYLRVVKKRKGRWQLTKIGEKLISSNYMKLVNLVYYYKNDSFFERIIKSWIPRSEWAAILPSLSPDLASYFARLLI